VEEKKTASPGKRGRRGAAASFEELPLWTHNSKPEENDPGNQIDSI